MTEPASNMAHYRAENLLCFGNVKAAIKGGRKCVLTYITPNTNGRFCSTLNCAKICKGIPTFGVSVLTILARSYWKMLVFYLRSGFRVNK